MTFNYSHNPSYKHTQSNEGVYLTNYLQMSGWDEDFVMPESISCPVNIPPPATGMFIY